MSLGSFVPVAIKALLGVSGPHYRTRYGRRNLSRAEQHRRIDAAKVKRLRRQFRNIDRDAS